MIFLSHSFPLIRSKLYSCMHSKCFLVFDSEYYSHFNVLLKEAKNGGDSITVETCPHYLAFSAEEIHDGDTRFKCAPPIRDAANKEKLWEALLVFYIP